MSDHIVDQLHQTIENRRDQRPEGSWTVKLLDKGTAKVAQKVGEEAVETVIEAMQGNRERFVYESADLLYHWLVLCVDQGVSPDEIWDELRKRHTP